MKKILFTSVLGPYGVDTHRSRYKNPMSLLANQVTRGQKYYTVQMAQRTFAFDLFAVNLKAKVAILDFPLEKNLIEALTSFSWDRIGTAAIVPNFEALLDTVDLILKYLPHIPIDIGGHIANGDEVLKDFIDKLTERHPKMSFNVYFPEFERLKPGFKDELSDWIKTKGLSGTQITFIRRDGLQYYKNFPGIGLREERSVFAPLVDASVGKKLFGLPIESTSAGLIIPDVGCPKACNFCATSHKFDGRFIKFLNTAEDIFQVAKAHEKRGKKDFFVMSENFSLHTKRALDLLQLMEAENKDYTYNVFSSADSLVKLGIENIVKLGYSFIWIGLEESSGTAFKKMNGINLKSLVGDLQNHGVDILGSTILGFEHQDKKDILHEIEHALSYRCVYNQFMLYMPVPGTALYKQVKQEGKLKDHFPWSELHGQSLLNWKHPRLSDQELEDLLDMAFELDYLRLGPSIFRMIETQFKGYLNTKDWNHNLVQLRNNSKKKSFLTYLPILSAMRRDLQKQKHEVSSRILSLEQALQEELGLSSKLLKKLATPFFSMMLCREKRKYLSRTQRRYQINPKTLMTDHGDLGIKLKGVVKCLPCPTIEIQQDRKRNQDKNLQTETLCGFK